MTIAMSTIPRRMWTGLSGDAKPTDATRVNQNDIFFETDTSLYSVFNGVSWFSYPVSGTASTVKGTTTNDNAPPGYLGERIISTVPIGSSVTLVTGVGKTITSISLTAGDWDVSGGVDLTTGGATNWTQIFAEPSPTDNVIAIGQAGGSGIDPEAIVQLAAANSAGNVPGATTFNVPLPVARISLAATTTIFLVVQASFTLGTMTAFGTIRARRVR